MAKGAVTRRSGDAMPEKNFHSHVQDALAHGLGGIDQQERRGRRSSAGEQNPPRTMISQGTGEG